MDISKISVKKIRELIVFTAFLVVALWKFDVVLDVLKAIWGIAFPFVLGGAIAFVTNVPMSFLEKKIFGRVKKENKTVGKLARPISLLLTIILAVGVIVLVMFGVIPQLTRTMGTLMMSIADFIPQMQGWIREFSHNNQEIMKLVNQVQFNPDQAIKWGISLLGNGAGNMMNTTMSAVGSIVSGLATFFIAFSFACYVLFQKEKLHVQIRKVFFAFLPKKKADAFLKICEFSCRSVSGSCDPRMHVCGDTEYFEDAICTFDRSFDCVYCIDSDFRGLYRMCGGKLFDLYGKSETGNFIYYSISGAAADRGKSDLSSCCG